MDRTLKSLFIFLLITFWWIGHSYSSQSTHSSAKDMQTVLEFDSSWNEGTQSPFVKNQNHFEFNKTIGSAERMVFPKTLDSQTPIRIHTELGEVRQYLASGGEYRAELIGRYLVYKGREGYILYRYDADTKSLREFVYLPEASSLPKDGQVIRWRFEGATMQEQSDGSIEFTKSADIPRKASTVQKTLFKIPPPEYINANHQVIRTGINHTLEKNQLALNLEPNSALQFPLWVDPTMVASSDAKGFIEEGRVDFIGDFNGDGFEDISVFDGNKVNLYFGQSFPLPAPLVPDVVITLPNPSLNPRTSSAGDFNGDGIHDLIIGDPGDSGSATGSGRTFVFFGRNPSSQLNLDALTQADIIISGSNEGDQFGASVYSLNNFDGEGPDDIMIYARQAIIPESDPENRSGSVYIFRGRNLTSQTIWDAESDADLILRGTGTDAVDILKPRPVGNFNGDATDDFGLISFNRIAQTYEFIIYESLIVGSDLQAVSIKTLNQVGIFGESLDDFEFLGDFNNDGFDDVLQGSPTGPKKVGACRGDDEENPGLAIIHLGHADGQPSPGNIEIAPCTGRIFGIRANRAGDINGDGFDDAAIYRGTKDDVVIVLGRSNLPTGVLWDDLDTDFIIEGILNDSQSAGNFDNDIADEILISGLTAPVHTYFHSFPIDRPYITINGKNPAEVEVGIPYVDSGATALDHTDGDISGNIITNGLPIDTSVPGTHLVTYDVTNSNGASANQAVRTVNVIEVANPSTITGFQNGVFPDESYGGTEDS